MLLKLIEAGAPPLTSAVPEAASYSQVAMIGTPDTVQVALKRMLGLVMCRVPFVSLRPDAVIATAHGNGAPPDRGIEKVRFVQLGNVQAVIVTEVMVAVPVVALVT
jgi:hypothetical protein